MLCLWVHMQDSFNLGGGIGWLAAGGIPNSLYRMPFFYLLLACALCYYCFFFLLFLFCFVFVFMLSLEFVDVILIFSCPADHVPNWQPRTLLGMVEARSVNVKNIHTQMMIHST